MIAADGCIQKNYLCMWGNITEDRLYYDQHVVPLFEKEFKIILNPHEKKSNAVYGFYLCNKKLVEELSKELNFKEGNKTYSVRIPGKIMESSKKGVKCAFIRGFADCDGCLNFSRSYGKYNNFKKTFHHYPRILLSSASKNLMIDLSRLLKECEIKHFIRKNGKNQLLEIKGVSRLEKWMELIGFSNPVQKTKYLIWKEYGFMPPKTSLNERFKILGGEINPQEYYGPIA